MKPGRSLVALAQELARQRQAREDLLVPSACLQCATDLLGSTALVITRPGGTVRYPLTALARRQLADKLKIPFAYFERMRVAAPALLDANLNTWLRCEDERRLVRTLDGQVRAVLSDRYRRLDNYDLAEAVLPMLHALPGAQFASVELTDTRLYLKVVVSSVACEIVPGDVVQAGVVIANSEVGHGSLSVEPLVYRLVCRNGLIAVDRAYHKTHVGRLARGDEASVTTFRDDTLAADDRALFLKVRDVVAATVSPLRLGEVARQLQTTRAILLPGDPVRTVTVLAQRHALTEPERGGVLRHLIAGGDLSGYGLLNAVTHFAQDVADYARATELEMLGGKLLDQSAREWHALIHA